MSGTRTLDYADRDAKPVPTKPRGLEYDINSQLRVELVCIESGNSDTREYKVLGLPKDGDGLIWGTIIDPKNGGFFFRSPNGVTAFTPAKNLPRLDEVFPPRTILAYRVIHEPVEPELSGGVPDTQAILLDEPNAEQQPSALSLAVSSVLNAPLSNSDAPQAYEIPEGIEIDPSFGLTLEIMAVILEGKWRYGVSNSLNSGLLSNTPITSDDNNCGVFARSNNGVTLFIPNRFLENPIATRGNLRTIHAFKVLN